MSRFCLRASTIAGDAKLARERERERERERASKRKRKRKREGGGRGERERRRRRERERERGRDSDCRPSRESAHCYRTAGERTWHVEDSHGQILASAFR